jgi:hypothetical protein
MSKSITIIGLTLLLAFAAATQDRGTQMEGSIAKRP